jgi:hypothetical protein
MMVARNSSSNATGLPVTEAAMATKVSRACVHTLDVRQLAALHSKCHGENLKSLFMAYASLGEQRQQVEIQQHEQQETKQPQKTTSHFAKDLTKAIETTRVEGG